MKLGNHVAGNNFYIRCTRYASIAVLWAVGAVLLALLIAYALDYVGFDLIDFLDGKVLFRVRF